MGLLPPTVGRAVQTACLCLAIHTSVVAAAEFELQVPVASVRLDRAPDGSLRVALDGTIQASPPGAPDLPWIPVTIPVPRGEEVSRWSAVPAGYRPLSANAPVVPAIDETETNRTGAAVADPAIYAAAADYPVDAVRYLGVQAGPAGAVAAFLVCPFRYDPGAAVLEVASSVQIVYETERSSAEYLPTPLRSASAPLVGTVSSVTDGQARPGAKGTPLYELEELGASRVPSLSGSPVEFLLVTTEEFAPAFAELIAWKNQMGVPAALRTVEEILDAYPQGADKPERIRLFLRDAYLYWGTRTVLVAGDPSEVPARYAQDYSWNGANGGVQIITDLYYACLDGNWNANGNSLYGEPRVVLGQGPDQIIVATDSADLRPELLVGRISCNTLAEAELYARKYREYAITPPTHPYLRDVLTMGEVLFESEWVIGDCDECATCPPNANCVNRDGAEDCILLAEQLGAASAGQAFQVAELYERDYWWVGRGRPNARALRLSSVVSEINAGVNVLFHSGHGDRDRLAIGPDRLEAANLRDLTNGVDGPGWAGMIYAINCNSAAIDYDCAAEAWHFSPEGGGLIYIGSTNLDFPSSAAKLQDLTFSVWPGDGDVTPGEAYFHAADSLARTLGDARSSDRFVLFSVAFLGDPEMPVWTDVPEPLSVSYDDEIPLGGGASTVVVLRDGSPVSGARVGLYKEGDALAAALTGSDGIAELEFRPGDLGEFSVTVTYQNSIPFRGTGEVVNGGGAFAALGSFAIDDVTDEDAGIRGNGDGVFDVGETVALDLEFENRGTGAIASLSASLALAGEIDASAGVDLQILDGEVALGPLGAGAQGSEPRAFLVRAKNLGGSAAQRVELPLELVWDQGGASHSEPLESAVHRPDLVMYASTVTEISGDSDGIPEAGEEFNVGLDFLNLGQGSPYGLEVRIFATPANRAIFDPPALPLVPAGPLGHVTLSEDFYVKYFFNHTTFRLNLEIWDVSDPADELLVSRRRFDMITPEPPALLAAQGFQSRVLLGWQPSASTDREFYRLYRSTNGPDGPYTLTGVGRIPAASAGADSAYFADEDLPSLSGFHYKVAVVDSSGNESIAAGPIEANTAPGPLAGWPVTLSDTNSNAPTIEQMNYQGFEVIVGTDVIYAFGADGSDYYDGDTSPSTRGVLSEDTDGVEFEGKPAVFDIDGDLEKEILAVSKYRGRGETTRALELTCFDHQGNVQWSQSVGGAIALSAPAIGDIDGDGDLEVVVLTGRSVWAFHHDGRPFAAAGAIRNLPDTEAFFLYGSVALADVYDGPEAGALEIILLTRPPTSGGGKLHILRAPGGAQDIPNFPITFADYGAVNAWSNSSPAVIDLDPDAEQGPALGEVFVTTRQDLWAIDPTAAEPVVWRRTLQIYENVEVNPSPALGDLDRDGDWEVVVPGGGSHLYVFDAGSGVPTSAFTTGGQPGIQVETARLGSPIIGDITGDMYPEILVGAQSGKVHAFDRNGQEVRGFPFVNGGDISAGLAVWDLNKDGTVELVIQANQVLPVTVLELPGTSFDHVNPDLGRYPWTMFRHDSRNSGNMMSPPITPLALQAPDLELVDVRRVQLRWLAQEGFARFELHRRDLRVDEWTFVGSYRPADLRTAEGFYVLEDEVPDFGTYGYRLVGVEPDGFEVETLEQSIEVSAARLEYALGPARPNPSGTLTTIALSLPQSGRGRVVIVDAAGRVVRTLQAGSFEAGIIELAWDGRGDDARPLGAGVYFARAELDAVGIRSAKLIRLE